MPKVSYFNCTATQPHIGCYAVTDAHFRMLLSNGYEIVHISLLNSLNKFIGKTREETVRNLEHSYIKDVILDSDAVIINGEGTIHHNQGQDLLCLAELARQLNRHVFLVNAVIEEIDGYDDILKNLSDLNVREIKSSDFLKKRGINHRVVLDSILEAGFIEKKILDFKDKIVLTDWHIKRDSDIGRKILEFERKNREDIVFLPLHHLYHIQNSNWRGIVASLSDAKLVITGRHHGVYLAGLAGVPIVALPSNTYKIEGTLAMFSQTIAFCDTDDILEDKIQYALRNRKIAKEFKIFLREHLPLSTFDKLYELVPSEKKIAIDDVNEKIDSFFDDLISITSKKELFDSYNTLQLRVHQSHKIELLTDKQLNLSNRIVALDSRIEQLSEIREKLNINYQELKSKYTDLKDRANYNQSKAREQVKLRSEKIAQLNEVIKSLKDKNKIIFDTFKDTGKKLFSSKDYENCREILFQVIKYNPFEFSYIIMLCRAEEYLYTSANIKPSYIKEFINFISNIPEDINITRAFATAMYYSYDYSNAKKYIKKLILQNDKNFYTYKFWLANCLRFEAEIESVLELYEELVYSDFEKKVDVYLNMISLYNQIGRFEKAKNILKIIYTDIQNSIEYNKDYLYYLSKNNFFKAWDLYSDNGIKKSIESYYNGEGKFSLMVEKGVSIENLLIIPFGGVGDEIRMSTIYYDMILRYKNNIKNIKIVCDYRLKDILSKTYPECKFISIDHTDTKQTKVPKRLMNYMNDIICKEAQLADSIIVNMTLLKYFRDSYRSFYESDKRRFIIDSIKVEKWKQKFKNIDKPKIGINKGTHLHTFIRNQNILEFDLWEEIFEIKDIEFINLSFDVTEEEIDRYNKKYNINIHNFPEEDLKNDIENLAALISEMDIVITPTNMIVDLAGSLDIRTICMYTTFDYDWRFKNSHKDVWHKNVIGVKSDIVMDKNSLMKNVKNVLKKLLMEKR